MSSEDATQPNDAPAVDTTSPQEGISRCCDRRHRFGRRGIHGWNQLGGDAPSGWGFHGYRWGILPTVEEPAEEEANEAEHGKEIPKLTKDEKKQLKQQFRRYILSRKNAGPRCLRKQLFHSIWKSRKACKTGKCGFGVPCLSFRGYPRFSPPCGGFGRYPIFGNPYSSGFGGLRRFRRFGGFGGFGGPCGGFKCHKFGPTPCGGFGRYPGLRNPYGQGFGGFGGFGGFRRFGGFGGRCGALGRYPGFGNLYGQGFGGFGWFGGFGRFGGRCDEFGRYPGFGNPSSTGFGGLRSGFKYHKFGLPPCGGFGCPPYGWFGGPPSRKAFSGQKAWSGRKACSGAKKKCCCDGKDHIELPPE